MKWTKRGRRREGGDAEKELMQMEITRKGRGRLNVNLLLTIPFYCTGCETLVYFLCRKPASPLQSSRSQHKGRVEDNLSGEETVKSGKRGAAIM